MKERELQLLVGTVHRPERWNAYCAEKPVRERLIEMSEFASAYREVVWLQILRNTLSKIRSTASHKAMNAVWARVGDAMLDAYHHYRLDILDMENLEVKNDDRDSVER